MLLIGISRSRSLWVKLVGYLVVGLMVGGVYMTFVRAGWVGLALALFTLALLWPPFRKPFLGVVAVAVVVIILNWSTISESYVFTERLSFTKSIESRETGITLAWQIFMRHPLVGAGFANFGEIAEKEFGWHIARWAPPSPHNSYLYIAASGGLVAIAPYLFMFFSILWDGWRLYRRGAQDPAVDQGLMAGFLAAMVAYLIPIFTMEIEASKLTNMVYYLIVGSVLGLHLWLGQPGGVRRIREEVHL